MRRRSKVLIAALVVAALLFLFVDYVPSDRIGVAGKGDSLSLLRSGLHLRPRWKGLTLYPTQPADIRVAAASETPQGKFEIDATLTVSVVPERALSLERSYRGRYADDLIAPLLAELLRHAPNLSSAASSPAERERLNQDLIARLGPSLAAMGLTVHSAGIESLKPIASPEDEAVVEHAARWGGKVVILGCDAFDWQIYRAVSRQRPMPNIQRLVDEGAAGDLTSLEPFISPMIWTTMATGVEPPVHGIIDFLMKDASTGEDIPTTSSMRRVPALWNMLTRFGMTSGFIGWLATYPAEPVRGFMVSDRIVFHQFDPRWQSGQAEGAEEDVEGLTYPEDLISEVRDLVSSYEDVGVAALKRYGRVGPDDLAPQARVFDPLDPVKNLRLVLASNITYERIAEYTYAKHRPQLFSVYLDLVDNVCHLFMPHMAPHTDAVSDGEAARFADGVAAAYARTDSLVGKWLSLIDGETTLILISDHGFKSGDLRPSGPAAIHMGQAVKWHRASGAIALYGNRVRRGATIRGASVLDVCPTILSLLGLPEAEDMPGRVIEEALDEAWLAASAATAIATYGMRTGLVGAGAPRRKDEEQAIVERLRALGYVGGTSGDLSKLGQSYFVNAEFDKAIEVWNEILKQEPDNVEVMTAIGNAYLQKGDLDKAHEVLSEAVRKNPNFLGAQNMLAMYYINVARFEEAARLSREIIAKDARNAEAYFNLGVIFDQRGQYDQALAAFKQSVELRGDYDQSRINLGNLYLRMGRPSDAKLQFEKAIEINPGDPHAWFLLGRAYQTMDRPQVALDNYREALKRSPGFSPARVSLAILLASKGDLEGAKGELEAGLAYPSDRAIILANLGILERQMGDNVLAEKRFKQAVETDPKYLPARLDLADLYASTGERGKARGEIEAVLRVDPGNQQAKELLRNLR